MRGKPRGYNKRVKTRIKIKRPKPIKTVATKEFQEVKKKIKEVNARIDAIEKKYGSDKWAVKKLKSRLGISEINGISKTGRVKRVSMRDKIKLKGVNKALDLFLKAKTSTLKGIEDTINKSKRTIKELLSDEEIDIDDEDAETFYDFYEEDDFKWLIDYIDPSELMVIIQEARSENWSENDFINVIRDYIEFGNDKDIMARLKRLYEHLIVKGQDF